MLIRIKKMIIRERMKNKKKRMLNIGKWKRRRI